MSTANQEMSTLVFGNNGELEEEEWSFEKKINQLCTHQANQMRCSVLLFT